MRKFKKFTYSNFCYLGTELIDLKIQVKKGNYVLDYTKGFCPEKISNPIALTAEESDKLDALFSELNFEKWKDKYENHDILDGEEWKIKVTFADGTKRDIFGMNARPRRWIKFNALLKWIHEKQIEYEAKP